MIILSITALEAVMDRFVASEKWTSRRASRRASSGRAGERAVDEQESEQWTSSGRSGDKRGLSKSGLTACVKKTSQKWIKVQRGQRKLSLRPARAIAA